MLPLYLENDLTDFDFSDLEKLSTSTTNSIPNYHTRTNPWHATSNASSVDHNGRITYLIDCDKEENNERKQRRHRTITLVTTTSMMTTTTASTTTATTTTTETTHVKIFTQKSDY
ncbi:unnamed protein product [Rotaria sp. Silwood2]|nr:unnamed protein product [Rotaria sp. Silwood2]CAF4186509.1 unnamed protein product [Rotaria sp. Silwood2]CAF4199181.1 unnamed protein product [Rotaria sp. Silwood2]CAF4293639.1 unnamed protein product [Rotaria sp. Silwood2]